MECINIILAATIPTVIIGTLINRTLRNQGIGVRTIQFIAVATLAPTILLLAFNKILDGAATAALIGSALGHLLGRISDFDQNGRDKN